MVAVVVAAREITARKPIEAGDVALRTVPQDVTNAAAFTTIAEVVGRISGVTVPTGQLVTKNLLASSAVGGQFSILKPEETVGPDSPYWRAISITVPDERAVAGLVQVGTTVDVFLTATVNVPESLLAEGKYYTDKTTKIAYQNMEILARTGTFYIVRAPLQVAEEIEHLQATGNATFSIALRPGEDTRIADTSKLGETTNLIITRYGLPVPEMYPSSNGPVNLPGVGSSQPTPGPGAAPVPSSSPSPAPSPAP
jgi:Flp pilus assembly protein CpaB